MKPKANLDIVLVNPGGRLSIYQELAGELAAIEPPVWAGLMATFVRIKGFSVEIVDAAAEDLAPEEVAARVAELKPKLTAVVVYGHQPSASTHAMPSAGAICAALKDSRPESKVLLVGGHVASLPEQTLAEEAADFVCSGEGPYTLSDLIAALKSGDDVSAVRGLCYEADGRVVRTAPAPLVTNPDAEMPSMAWDLLPMDRYRAHNWHCFDGLQRQPYASIYTSLGCPFKCSFCCIQAPFKEGEAFAGHRAEVNTYRRWSVDTVMDTLGILVNEYGVRNVKFADEMFVLNRKHVGAICDGILERGYDLNIWAYARVDTIQDGMAEKLKAAGFHWLALGIEAANARVRDQVQKGYGQEDIFRTVRSLQDAGIYIIANYIFGLPEDDLGTMQETLDLAMDLNSEFANFYCAMAYPGSDLYDTAIHEGWDLPETWSGYSQHSVDSAPLPTRHVSRADVLQFRDNAFNTYYANPDYLKMIDKRFGPETVKHIEDMASRKLERKYV